MKKSILLVVVVIVITTATLCTLFVTSNFIYPAIVSYNIDSKIGPYENSDWQVISFFDYGNISVPQEWTYSFTGDEIVFYDVDGKLILYIYKEPATIPSELQNTKETTRYKINTEMGTGFFRPSANAFRRIYGDQEYYFATFYTRNLLSIFRGEEYFGSLFASSNDIDQEVFLNIVKSYQK